MMQPSFDVFCQKAASSGLVPVFREVIADLDTPLAVFAKVAGDRADAFLLESLEGGEEWGRYSFIGFDPLALFASNGDKITITRQDAVEERTGDPIEELKQMLASFRACTTEYLPRFFGGAVGYLGYDMVRFMERLPTSARPFSVFPDSAFMIPRTILVIDNLKQKIAIVNCVSIPAGMAQERQSTLLALYQEALAQIEAVATRLAAPLPAGFCGTTGPLPPHDFTANMDQAAFEAMVRRAKEYIVAGDIFQVVLSQRFHTRTTVHPFLLYRALRHINPSPYLYFLKLGEQVLIGSSPEILVRLEEGTVEVRPIAGTRKRGATEEEDRELEQELLADPKERAEHLMLVDLGRNDTGRVAVYGTVEVKDLLVIERYSHVMHIVSGVKGQLAPGRDQFDVLRATFPAGTVSGAPKIRAMEIIDELEPERRGPYAGAMGYFGFSGNMDLCITIRTMVMNGEDLWIQAGAGIVADSDPEREFEETVNKAKGLRQAMELAERGLLL